MMKRWQVVVATALLLTQSAGLSMAAPATEAEQQSRRHFEKAEEHFRGGLFGEALAEYQAGYEVAPLPGFLINIAQCQRRLGNLNQALVTYRKFIMVAPDSHFVPEVKKIIDELQTLIDDEEKASSGGSAAAGAATNLQPPPVTAAPEEGNRADLLATPSSAAVPETRVRWWLWGSIAAAVVVGATVAVLALKDPGTTTVTSGSLGTLRR